MGNNTDPFAPDPSTPGISPSGSSSNFNFSPDDLGGSIPAKRTFPWKPVALIGGIVLLVTLIGVGLAFLLPNVINTPEKAVKSYYEALYARDTVGMREYIDPDDLISVNAAPILLSIEQTINDFIAQQGVQIDLNWELQNLTYQRIEDQKDYATVEVTGRLLLYETSTNISLTFPYAVTHELVRKNGQWLITTQGQPVTP
jgi:hypothetical protein